MPPSTIQSHLVYTFSPRVHILTSRTYSHLACPPPPFKVTSCTHSHLEYTFSPCVHILTSRAPLHHSKSPRVHILTSRTHSHLTYIFSPRVPPSTIQSHLVYTFSPRVHILTLRTYSHLVCSPPSKIISFTLAWKNSQKSHAATPIPSIRYLLRATNNRLNDSTYRDKAIASAVTTADNSHYFLGDVISHSHTERGFLPIQWNWDFDICSRGASCEQTSGLFQGHILFWLSTKITGQP